MTTAALRRILESLPAIDANDGELLRRFAQTRDEPAFSELINRHGTIVYGTAI